MDLEIKKDTIKHRYYVGDSENSLAEAFFVVFKDYYYLTKTVVSETLRGSGIGNKLVCAIADEARKNNYKIVAFCSYADAVLKKHPEYSDIMYKFPKE